MAPSFAAITLVAPGVRFSAFAIFVTPDFPLAIAFIVRTSSFVHARRTALFAFGRAVFAAVTRLLAVDLGVGRRAIAREVERLKPLVTALISKVMVKGQCGPDAPEVAVAE